jgi:hypothetical protein
LPQPSDLSVSQSCAAGQRSELSPIIPFTRALLIEIVAIDVECLDLLLLTLRQKDELASALGRLERRVSGERCVRRPDPSGLRWSLPPAGCIQEGCDSVPFRTSAPLAGRCGRSRSRGSTPVCRTRP